MGTRYQAAKTNPVDAKIHSGLSKIMKLAKLLLKAGVRPITYISCITGIV